MNDEHATIDVTTGKPAQKVYSVPRRYDLATMLTVTLAYALLFGAMRGFGWPPFAFALVAGFITCVGAAQALLFGGKRPRASSVLAGAVYLGITGAVVALLQSRRGGVAFTSAMFLVQGALVGYVAGAIVGGVFLIAELLRRAAARFLKQNS